MALTFSEESLMSKFFVLIALLIIGNFAHAEDSISCGGGSTELVLQDDGAIRFTTKDLGVSHYQIVKQTPFVSEKGVQTALHLLIDDGSDSRKMLFKFGKLNECEGETSHEILSVPNLSAPKAVKTLVCECVQT